MFLDKLKTLFSSDTELFAAPGGGLMSISKMKDKASYYSYKFDESDDLTDLDAALQYNKAVVEAAQLSGHPFLASYLETLSYFHYNRFAKVGDHVDLNEALQSMKAAIDATPVGDPALPQRHSALARSYALMFREFDDLDALELAFKFQYLAIDGTPEGDPALLERETDLSVSYSDRFDRLGNKEDLEKSLKYSLSVVAAVASDDPELPRYQQSLAATYASYFDTLGELNALQSALHWNKLAVENTPPGHSDLPFRQECLAVVLIRYFDKVGMSDDILSAIEFGRLALDATPVNDLVYPHRQNILALAYSALYHRYGNLRDLEEAIRLEQNAVDATPPSNPKLPVRQFNLAISHTAQFRRLGDIKDLELALKYNTAALEKIPQDHPTLAFYQRSLSLSYLYRFESLKDMKDIDRAMEYIKAAIEGTPTDQHSIRECQKSLAICHKVRFDILEQLEDVNIAIELLKLVLDTSPDGEMHLALFFLGVLYLQHYAVKKDLESLESSLVYSLKAVEAIPSDHLSFSIYHYQVGVVYRNQFREFNRPEDLQNALAYLHKATNTSNSPSSVWNTSKFWGKFACTLDLAECLDAYSIAFRNLSQLIWIGNSISARHSSLVTFDIPSVAADAAAAAIKFEKLELAVEFFDQGLAVTYKQLLELRDKPNDITELAKQYPELTKRLKEVSQHLQQMEAHSLRDLTYDEKHRRDYHLLSLERTDLIKEIQQLKGFGNLFMPLPFKNLSVAAKHGPVIMINCTELRSDAIIILPAFPYIKVVPLPQVNPEVADKVLEKLRHALKISKIQSRSPEPDRHGGRFRARPEDSQKLFREVVSWLSMAVVDLVFQALAESDIYGGRIWWCPSGAFTYLPLHAAGIDSPFLQSYTSTLDALIQARNKKPLAFGVQGSLITALGVSTLPNQSHLSLPSVTKELAAITSIVGESGINQLKNIDGGVDSVLEHIQKSIWLHLACHGEQNPVNPLESGLLLRDGKLQLSQILAKNLPTAQHVFLSACQTAMGDSGLANESMHLAGGFIAAGFKGAVGTIEQAYPWQGNLIGPSLTCGVKLLLKC